MTDKTKKEIIDTYFWGWGLTYKEIAKRFKVSISTVGRAIRNCIYYKPIIETMNILSLFSGIEGFVKGFEMAGFKFDKHYTSEIDKYANAITRYNYPNAIELGSVTGVKGLKDIDIVTFGFPCQDLSIAGNRAGFKGSRSSLFFEAIRIIQETKPRMLIFENVKGLFSSNGGRDFITVLRTIADIGLYECEWQLVNTRWVLPQNRERVYFIGHLRGNGFRKVFPIGNGNENYNEMDRQQLTKQDNTTYNIDTGNTNAIEIIGNVGNGHEAQNVYSKNGIAPTVREMHGKVTKTETNSRIRRLTPIECERLQGFPDNWTKYGIMNDKQIEISDSQRYKTLGNAVTTKIVKLIAERL